MTRRAIPEPIKFDSPLRERIHRRLGLVGEGPQAFYRDALRLLTAPMVESTTHLVSHLLREIESALRDVLEPIAHYEGRVKGKGTQTHEQQVRFIIGALGLSDTEGPGAAWLELVQIGLHELAHRRSLERPRPFDEQFRALWADVEVVLDAVLERFESRFLELHDEADRLLAKPVPSKADLKYLKDYLPNNPVTRNYFFSNLPHAGWLEPLAEAGFFSDPPAAIHDAQAGTTSYPYWPVANYLKRMAGTPASQAAVANVLREILEVDNALVHEAVTEALLELPADLAAVLVNRVAAWVKRDTFTRLPQKAGDLAVRLLTANRTGEAFLLLHAILDPGRFPSGEGTRARSIDTYWYSEVLTKCVPDFSRRNPLETLHLLSDLLEQAIGSAESDPRGELYSSVRRRSIERSQRWRQYEVVDMLVDAVRDAALAVVRTDPEQTQRVVAALEGRELAIFRRIALHVLGNIPTAARDLIEERLRRRETFDHWHREPEYIRLLQVGFDGLSSTAKDEILGWIEQGPSLDNYEPRSEEEFAAIKRSWQRSRLKPLQGQLPTEWIEHFGPFDAKEAPDDSEDEENGGWVGPASPRSADELTALTPEDLVELLRSWRPKAGWREASPEGLGRTVAEAVGKDPSRVAERATVFRGLEPTYVRAVVRGLEEALKNGHTFKWPPLLDLCEWVVTQPREDERGRSDWERDPGWSWSRKAVASLIAKGFDSESNRIPIEAREQVWRILEPVTWDPDPSPERDVTGDDDDPFHAAINSVRGEGMIAAIRYGVWVERHAREAGGPAGMANMPELERNLSEHLDAAREPSPAVRSVVGESFPTLHWVDAEWAAKHIEHIFMLPTDSLSARGAWATYLRFCRPYNDLFPLLEPLYRDAVQRLDPGAAVKADIDSVEYHLTTHLMSFYWRRIDGAEPLARELLLRGGESVRHAAFDFIGRDIMNTEGDLPAEALAPIQNLWEWWRQEGHARQLLGKELEAFGWWFASERFEWGWAETQALWVLGTGSSLEPDHVVVQQLQERVKTNPLAAVTILDSLWENIHDPWSFHGWRDECRNILQTALASDNEEARSKARALVNKLAARGHLEFRTLLTP